MSTERNVCSAFVLLLALGVKLVKIFDKNIKYFNMCYKMSPYPNNRATIDNRDTVSGENYSQQILLALPPAKRSASQLRARVNEYRYISATPLGLNNLFWSKIYSFFTFLLLYMLFVYNRSRCAQLFLRPQLLCYRDHCLNSSNSDST
jgi:hypothetical protein